MDSELAGRFALVTGGTSGIGLAIALELAAEGVRVAVASRQAETLSNAIADELRSKDIVRIQADVSREEDVCRMVEQAEKEFGHIDLYVNNAAIAQHQPITKLDSDSFRTVVDTNLAACIWGSREVAKRMIPRKKGGILVVGSTSMYTPGPAETVYRITKMGLKSIVQNLAIELAPFNIRANLLVPGHYRTRLTSKISPDIEEKLKQNIPLRRFGATSECGKAAVFLLSDALSGYTTGAELIVDGGLALRPLYFGTDADLSQLNTCE
jgi:NAD(P)-dependent dehydrogenase (short-subunit alcohol dehydrogenase family)